jgi:putative ABC transport system permease protein
MLKEWLTHLRSSLVGNTQNEVDEELLAHLEQQTDANIAAGMAPEEARRQAVIAFGGVERARGDCREQRPGFWLEILVRDVRYSIRGLWRNPTFTVTVVLTMMLGIGATTAVFSVVDRILFRSLPYAYSGRLVSVGLVAPIEPQEFMLGGSYYEWRDNQKPFDALTSETGVEPCDLAEEKPERLFCAGVESNFLPTLGVNPIIGRNFTEEEDTPNGPKVALLSYGIWSSRFHLDPGVVGKLIHIDGHAVRIVGVLPNSFEMPRLQAADLLLPQALDEAAQRRADPGRPMWAFARLKPGVSIDQAEAELQPLFEYSLRLAPPQFRKEVHLRVRSLRDRQVHDARLTAWVLLGLVIAVLLVACSNVTSLMLARGASRERELAVRSALGAGRTRLVRQALTESIMLSLTGAVAGCLFAELLLHIFIATAPDGMPFLTKARIDARIVCFTLLISVLCGALFGLVPALQYPRPQALTGRSTVTGRHATLRQLLVVAQIATSMVLLAGGALLFRSFWNLQNQRLGMSVGSVVTASVSLGQSDYPTPERQMEFYQRLVQQLKYGPGVTALAISDSLPPGGYHHDQIFASMIVEGRPKYADGTGGMVVWRWVTPEYFRTLDIPIVQGRGFTDEDMNSVEHVVVLSKALATRMFPGQDPVGQHLLLGGGAPDPGGPENPWYTVAGVAADVKNGGLTGGDEPEYYRLRRNVAQDWSRASVILMKTNLPAGMIEDWARTQTAALDPAVPVQFETLSERVNKMADQPRFETLLVGFFASTGLALSVIGLYGVISFLVAQRTHEIGIRLAVGATRSDILKLVMASGLRLIVTGTLLGLLLALAASRTLSSLLFNVGPQDPVAFGCVTFLLVSVALVATLIPAASATAVSPTVALRCD